MSCAFHATEKKQKENVPVVSHAYLSYDTEKILQVLITSLDQVVEMVLL